MAFLCKLDLSESLCIWQCQEAMETMIACSAMALLKQRELKNEETKSPKSSWQKWKRGGIIGAAALTGGTLLAITGGILPPIA